MTQPFWEKAYRGQESVFGADPSSEIRDLAAVLPPRASILDMGCGEGRNALFLAEMGFRVDAFDISRPGIEKLLRAARAQDLTINAWVEDMREFVFRREYGCIISHGVLHLLARDEWAPLIAGMKAHTRPGGVNVVAVFTDRLPTPEDLEPFVKGLFEEGELAHLYGDWHLRLAKSYIKHDEHPDDVRHAHPIDKIVACKPFP